LCACDIGAAAEQPIDAPPLHLVEILAATSTDASGALVYEPLASGGATRVLANSPIKLRFDRLLFAPSVTRQAICLQPLQGTVNGPNDCAAGAFLEPAYDPVLREATFRQGPANPPLLAGTLYTLTPYVALLPDDPGFRTFEGVGLDQITRWELTVREDGALSAYDTIPTSEHYCASPRPDCASACASSCVAKCPGDGACEKACLDPCVAACPRSVAGILGKGGCSQQACHRGSTAPEGLDMSSPAALARTAIGVAAHETQTGEHARTADQVPPRFGRAMPLLDPGVPGNSYLVYKLLATRGLPLVRPLDAAEITRVQRDVISGMPMPPQSAFGASLRAGEPEWLAEWILQGTPVHACQ
jgi:hypothetical protein